MSIDLQGRLFFVKKKNNKKIQKLNGSLSHSAESALKKYFKTLNGQKPNDLYKLVLKEIERPLMKEVMRHTDNNQSEASIILGINRSTLRKKLKQYKLI